MTLDVSKILGYLPLILVVVTASMAIGSQQMQISNIQKVVDQRQRIVEQQARIDERTKNIEESQKRQEQMLQKLLDKALSDTPRYRGLDNTGEPNENTLSP